MRNFINWLFSAQAERPLAYFMYAFTLIFFMCLIANGVVQYVLGM